MAIVEARYSCRIVITASFLMNFYNWDIKFPQHLLNFFKCQSVKNFDDFSNLQASSPKMSQDNVNCSLFLRIQLPINKFDDGKNLIVCRQSC